MNALKTETQKLNKMREMIQRKLRQVEDQKGDIERERETLRSQITGLERGEYNFVAVRHREGMRDCAIKLLGWREVLEYEDVAV